jgi:hypothetical protein
MTIVEHNWSALRVPRAIEVLVRIPTSNFPIEMPVVAMDF